MVWDQVREDAASVGSDGLFSRRPGREHAGLLLVLEPVALALDVDGGGVVQQPVQQCCGEDGSASLRGGACARAWIE